MRQSRCCQHTKTPAWGATLEEGNAVTSTHQTLHRVTIKSWPASEQHQEPPAQRAAEIGRRLPQLGLKAKPRGGGS